MVVDSCNSWTWQSYSESSVEKQCGATEWLMILRCVCWLLGRTFPVSNLSTVLFVGRRLHWSSTGTVCLCVCVWVCVCICIYMCVWAYVMVVFSYQVILWKQLQICYRNWHFLLLRSRLSADLGRIAGTPLNGWVYLTSWFKYIQRENCCKNTKPTL